MLYNLKQTAAKLGILLLVIWRKICGKLRSGLFYFMLTISVILSARKTLVRSLQIQHSIINIKKIFPYKRLHLRFLSIYSSHLSHVKKNLMEKRHLLHCGLS